MKKRTSAGRGRILALFLAALFFAAGAGAQEEQEETPAETPEGPAAEEEIELDAPLALEEEIPGLDIEAAPDASSAVENGGWHEHVVVTGTAWRRGERREYVVLFDHIPIGRQAYMFAGVGARRGEAEGKNLNKAKKPRRDIPAAKARDAVAVFDIFETLDVRFFGTPGRAVSEGRLVMSLKGEPLYYRLERNFDPFTRYSVNRPLLDRDDYMKHQVWLRDARKLEYAESRFRRGEGARREAALAGKADMILDFPLLGHFAMHFQFAPLEKMAKAKKPHVLRALAPFERPPLDLFVPQNVHATFAPRVEEMPFRVERERDPGAAGFAAEEELYRVVMPLHGFTLWFDGKGKMLRAETNRGMTLALEE